MTTQTTTPTLVHTREALAAALAVQDVQAVPRTEGRWDRALGPAAPPRGRDDHGCAARRAPVAGRAGRRAGATWSS